MIEVKQGDCLSVLKTLPEDSIDLVYTTPSPFGYYDNRDKVGGEESISDYVNNLINVCNECSRVLKPTGSLFIQLGDQYQSNGLLYGIPIYFENKMRGEGWALNDRLIWHRTETLPLKKKYEDKGFLKNYEFIFHFVHKDFYFNTNSKYIKTSVHSYPLGDSYYSNEFDSGLPEQLSRIIIDSSCPPNGTVLDPLAGSGKLGVVAKKMDRNAILIDIDPEVCNLMKIRLGL